MKLDYLDSLLIIESCSFCGLTVSVNLIGLIQSSFYYGKWGFIEFLRYIIYIQAINISNCQNLKTINENSFGFATNSTNKTRKIKEIKITDSLIESLGRNLLPWNKLNKLEIKNNPANCIPSVSFNSIFDLFPSRWTGCSAILT